jgi:hypothetical protein
VPGSSVAYMLGAVTVIESEAVIDGTSLSGAMPQDRFASAPHIKARAAARGQKSASWPAVPTLRALDWPAIILRQRKG